MIFSVGVRLHVHFVLVALDPRDNLHVAGLELGLEIHIALLKIELGLGAGRENNILGMTHRQQLFHPLGVYRTIDKFGAAGEEGEGIRGLFQCRVPFFCEHCPRS